jgi:hypothetical protein
VSLGGSWLPWIVEWFEQVGCILFNVAGRLSTGADVAAVRLPDSVCARNAIQRRDSGVSESTSERPQEPHKDQNRTTPGTNLLPSINPARVKRAFRLKRKCFVKRDVDRGPGMGGSQVRVCFAYASVACVPVA